MSFDFNILSHSIQGGNIRPVNTQATNASLGVLSAGNTQINKNAQIDKFIKTAEPIPQIRQGGGFESAYQQYYSASKINGALNSNIQNICDKNGISSLVTAQQVINIDRSHLEKTYEYAMMIGNRMGLTPNEKEDLRKGSILHDIGKAYIPSSIINKPGKLTDEERSVINSHSELGGEVAKQFGANETIVDMIKNHHAQTTDNKLCGILQVADRYSALTQKRPYKNSFSPALTFKILDQEVQDGKLNGEALNALKQAINAQNNFYKPIYKSA